MNEPEFIIFETSAETTATNVADFATLTIPGRPSREARLHAAWLVLESTNTARVEINLRLPAGTVAAGPGVIGLAKGWLRAHTPNVGTINSSYNLTDTLSWYAPNPSGIPLRRREERPADANVDASVLTIAGATVGWTLYALIEYVDVKRGGP